MYIDVEGHHSGGSSFINENDFCYYRNCLYIGTSSALRKKQVNESQYIVSRPDSVRIRHSGRIGDGVGHLHSAFLQHFRTSLVLLQALLLKYVLIRTSNTLNL